MISASIPNDTRKAVYARDGYACALCDSKEHIQIHHCEPRSVGGSDFPENLITLCSVCHALAHGTKLRDCPDMTMNDVYQACVEYLADYYAPDWYPYK